MENKYITNFQRQSLYLMQALLGAITPNFRMVWFSIDDNEVIRVTLILEKESADDEEEIDDLKSEFEALQEKPIKYCFNVVISDEDLIWPNENSIVVYRRKEY